MTKFDDGNDETNVFDEIDMSDLQKLARSKKYCDEHSYKIIIATGNTSQLEPINSFSASLITTTIFRFVFIKYSNMQFVWIKI